MSNNIPPKHQYMKETLLIATIEYLTRCVSKKLWKYPRNLASVTRLGDILYFGQLFKAFGNN